MAELVCEKCQAVSKNSKIFCRECGGKLVMQEPKHTTKLRKAGVKTLKRTVFIVLILGMIAAIIVVGVIGYFMFSISGFNELKPSGDEEVKALHTISFIHNESKINLLMMEGEATFVCNQLLKKSIKGDKEIIKAKRRLEIKVNGERKTVSTILYDKIQKELDIRCELIWTAGDSVPELKDIRLGKLYLPKLLHVPILKFFVSRVVIGPESTLLVKRIEQITIAANNTLRVTLDNPRKME